MVIQLGTNGTVTQAQYDAVLAEVADVPRVVMMTVKAPKPWIDGNNEIIRALPATHPNVVVLDWQARAAEVPAICRTTSTAACISATTPPSSSTETSFSRHLDLPT